MNSVAYFNGSFIPAHEAHVGLADGGLLHGAGLFETMRAEGGRVFRLESHLRRLQASAAKLMRPIDRDRLPSADAFTELLERNDLREARVRLTLAAGPMQEEVRDTSTSHTLFATAMPLKSLAMHGDEGIGVVICPFRQTATDPLAGHKSTSYLPRLLGLREAQAARRGEALWFTTQNLLAEGCISNVFLVCEGVLRTPPIDTPVVPGIARGTVLELAARSGVLVREEPLTIDDLLDSDEVFLTNAIMQVVPVLHVEKRQIAGGRPGPIARQLLEQYRSLVGEECAAT